MLKILPLYSGAQYIVNDCLSARGVQKNTTQPSLKFSTLSLQQKRGSHKDQGGRLAKLSNPVGMLHNDAVAAHQSMCRLESARIDIKYI